MAKAIPVRNFIPRLSFIKMLKQSMEPIKEDSVCLYGWIRCKSEKQKKEGIVTMVMQIHGEGDCSK